MEANNAQRTEPDRQHTQSDVTGGCLNFHLVFNLPIPGA